jgi:hypothetical protein
MSDEERESGEDPTQEQMDDESTEGGPADVGSDDETESTPHEGEEGQADDVA